MYIYILCIYVYLLYLNLAYLIFGIVNDWQQKLSLKINKTFIELNWIRHSGDLWYKENRTRIKLISLFEQHSWLFLSISLILFLSFFSHKNVAFLTHLACCFAFSLGCILFYFFSFYFNFLRLDCGTQIQRKTILIAVELRYIELIFIEYSFFLFNSKFYTEIGHKERPNVEIRNRKQVYTRKQKRIWKMEMEITVQHTFSPIYHNDWIDFVGKSNQLEK